MTTWDGPGGMPVMRCDVSRCGASLSFEMIRGTGSVDFAGGNDRARVAGWKIWTENGTWHQLCGRHAEDERFNK